MSHKRGATLSQDGSHRPPDYATFSSERDGRWATAPTAGVR